MILECVKPLLDLQKKFEKQGNRVDEIAENLPPEKYPSVSAVIAFVKNKIELFSEAVGKVYLKATDFEDYKTDASNTYVTKTDVEEFENNVADTYATKTDVENFENNIAETYATKTDVEDLKTDTEVIATATGKAITINPANAPIPQLILRGETTQDGTELKSVGDSGSFEVGVYGGNLAKLPTSFKSQNLGGVEITVNKDGSITFNGTNPNFDILIEFENVYLQEGKSYTLSGFNGMTRDRAIFYINSDSAFDAKLIQSNGAVTKTCRKSGLYPLRIYIYKGTTINQTIYPMLNIGSIALPYEPYKAKQTLTFTDTLRGKGDIADEKDFARGVTTQRFRKVVFDGSNDENWNEYNETTQGLSFFVILNDSMLGYQTSMCDKYSNVDVSWGAKYIGQFGIYSDHTVQRYKYFRPPNASVTTVVQWKTWLSENPIELVYALETPIETPISESELNAYRQLYTNKGNTTILNSDGADMEISYYINKPNAQAIGNIHSQVNKDYFKLQQAIISLGGN